MHTIFHQSIQNNWTKPEQILSPKTLVIGSFNPYNAIGEKVDYYYGRSGNYFWKRIAIIIGFEENYFFDPVNGFKRKLSIMNNKFCCLDVINSIEFSGSDDNLIKNYVDDHIFKKFSDDKVFTRKVLKGTINLAKGFNKEILTTLNNTNTIKKVIHTMGNTRIPSPLLAKPFEKKLAQNGFGGFIAEIHKTCSSNNIEFVNESLSPSAYAVRNGATSIPKLDTWLSQHLNLVP
ncbi:hypothetical protein EZ449_21940 [Pedobacter frigidisoli]|uniref:G/U mismatch-specific uracil-DNA glycosylase n=1 Tax=Pedobacter frigidisoli TaxID=2530455 RepID=A0A4R0NDZ3_9SPHI|nr:hypothetical protein [Pedobacter frigidisoli]TCC97483.1 hypothetical protein EZ449_21940 [Pedobacter frigidisoli]